MARASRLLRLAGYLRLHRTRIAITLLPLLVALAHATGLWPLSAFQRLDDLFYDARLRLTMPRSLDERIVIVDIDEASLASVGQWPWPRNRVAALAQEILDRQRAAVLAFDLVFAEPDRSSGLHTLRQLAQGTLRATPGFPAQVHRLEETLDYDAALARTLAGRAVILGYYFTSDRDGRASGHLPAPVMSPPAAGLRTTHWSGYGANIEVLGRAAPKAGFFNAITDPDGVVRALPLIAEYGGQYYESLSLAVLRHVLGNPEVTPGLAAASSRWAREQVLDSLVLRQGDRSLALPVDDRAAALIPFRGPGGPAAGSYRYISARDLLEGRLAAGSLHNRIVLLGTTAPGLLDLRVTPVGEAYPGVETHANLISGLLDGQLKVRPDYSAGYEVLTLLIAGLVLALVLPALSAGAATGLSLATLTGLGGLNLWLYAEAGLVLPLATGLSMTACAAMLNMGHGYFVEARSKRELAQLFGTYVPPELVREMLKAPDSYSMQAETRELTVMFCDMRGFTRLSENMEPTQLQSLLNRVFTRLTAVISQHRGTIDKYMGDCVMAFWGAPVECADHAARAVEAALAMAEEVRRLNEELARQGLPGIGVGIGLNTGRMCVGDMGSDIRRSYTVIGDAVNLGSRLEGLSRLYGVDIVCSASTRAQVPGRLWQELDRVRVKGKEQAVTVYTPLAGLGSTTQSEELQAWQFFLQAYRAADWPACETRLRPLLLQQPQKVLYQLYAERVASHQHQTPDPAWDGTTRLDTK